MVVHFRILKIHGLISLTILCSSEVIQQYNIVGYYLIAQRWDIFWNVPEK